MNYDMMAQLIVRECFAIPEYKPIILCESRNAAKNFIDAASKLIAHKPEMIRKRTEWSIELVNGSLIKTCSDEKSVLGSDCVYSLAHDGNCFWSTPGRPKLDDAELAMEVKILANVRDNQETMRRLAGWELWPGFLDYMPDTPHVAEAKE